MPYIKLSEYCAKKIFDKDWPIINLKENYLNFLNENSPCILKVDQFVKRRGQKGLIKLNVENNFQINDFVNTNDSYNNFILEKQVNIKDEKYFSIMMENGRKKYLFNHKGGIGCNPYDNGIVTYNLSDFNIPILKKLDKMFDEIYCNFLEVNPLVLTEEEEWVPVDFAVEVDSCGINFWPKQYQEYYKIGYVDNEVNLDVEKKIKDLDEMSGASLKFKVLNPNGNILTLIAGGGASVLFTDAIVNRGYSQNLYNYGEYSGNPSEDEVYQYCMHIFLSWFSKNISDRVLIIGGGISNFTDVLQTFKGVIKAINLFKNDFIKNNVKVFVRRGGVNEEVALKNIYNSLSALKIPIVVKGANYPITQIVTDALENKSIIEDVVEVSDVFIDIDKPRNIHLWNDRVIFVGMHIPIIQRIIDYDYFVRKSQTDIVCIYNEFAKKSYTQRLFWGNEGIEIPVTNNVEEVEKILDGNNATVYNYSSIRSCENITLKLSTIKNIKTFYVIAEGLPEIKSINLTNKLLENNQTLLGPSSVGAIKSGCNGHRIGSVGGLISNIQRCKLATTGNVAIMTKSGGLLNEMINFCANIGLSVGEAVSIGGDRYAGIRFLDLIKYYENDENIKLIIMVGETGGTGEIDAANWWENNGKTPVIAWCSGTSEKSFSSTVEFGHAGASSNSEIEEANNKNNIMRRFGLIVPDTFETIGDEIKKFSAELHLEQIEGKIVPLDIPSGIKNNLVRLKPNFSTELTDERTDLKYRGEDIDDVIERDYSLGYVIGQMWLNVRLDNWASKFIEKSMLIMADHGPAVSGAQNTIITARAGKGLVESLVSGLLTIGPRFGGAVADAGKDFYRSWRSGETPLEFINRKKREGSYIMGIGHRVKSRYNPDKRVEILKKMVKEFPEKQVFEYALNVEKETLNKKANLILNVDGAIGAALVDILLYYSDNVEELLEGDLLNGFFVLARSIGFIGHYNEQKIQKNGLFRANPWDIEYKSIVKKDE